MKFLTVLINHDIHSVAIGEPKHQACKAWQCGSKQQQRSHVMMNLLLLVCATHIWVLNLWTFYSWWIAHLPLHWRRGYNNINYI